MTGFHVVFYSRSFALLLVCVTQDFNTVEDASTSVDFWVVSLVLLHLSPPVVHTKRKFLIFVIYCTFVEIFLPILAPLR